jgi:hypothetical protein
LGQLSKKWKSVDEHVENDQLVKNDLFVNNYTHQLIICPLFYYHILHPFIRHINLCYYSERELVTMTISIWIFAFYQLIYYKYYDNDTFTINIHRNAKQVTPFFCASQYNSALIMKLNCDELQITSIFGPNSSVTFLCTDLFDSVAVPLMCWNIDYGSWKIKKQSCTL